MEASLHCNAPYSELEQRRCNHADKLSPDSYLLEHLKSKVERDFIASGGIREKMHTARIAARSRPD